MKNLLLLIVFIATLIVLPDSYADAMNGWWEGPYGDYCPMWGSYGARKPVRTAEEARKILKDYFSYRDVKIGKIKEREWFFEAEIRDKGNNLMDIVIV